MEITAIIKNKKKLASGQWIWGNLICEVVYLGLYQVLFDTKPHYFTFY